MASTAWAHAGMDRAAGVTSLDWVNWADAPAAFSQALGLAARARAELFLLDTAGGDAGPGLRPSAGAVLAGWGRGPTRCELGLERPAVRVHPLDGGRGHVHLRNAVAGRVAALRPDLVIFAPRAHLGVPSPGSSGAAPVARDIRCMSLFVPAQGRALVTADRGRVDVRRVVVALGPELPTEALVAELERLLVSLSAAPVRFTLLHVGTWSSMPSVSLPTRPGWTFHFELRTGAVVDVILEACDREAADLLAMPTRGFQGLFQPVFGTTARQVVDRCPCPVLAVPVPERDALGAERGGNWFRARAQEFEARAS